MFCGYLSIYWWNPWNPCKSLDFFNIFSDFTSVYCEIREILIICNIFVIGFLSRISVYKSVGAGFRRGKGGIIILYLFSETINYLLMSFITLYISIRIQFLDLFLWSGVSNLHYKSSIYLHKSSDFLNIFEDFILVYC